MLRPWDAFGCILICQFLSMILLNLEAQVHVDEVHIVYFNIRDSVVVGLVKVVANQTYFSACNFARKNPINSE